MNTIASELVKIIKSHNKETKVVIFGYDLVITEKCYCSLSDKMIDNTIVIPATKKEVFKYLNY